MWTYLRFNEEGEMLPGEREKFPPCGTAFLAFDALRWKLVIGYRERGDYLSFLDPNVNDDCNLVAFAPLSELKPISLVEVLRYCPLRGAAYPNAEVINLHR